MLRFNYKLGTGKPGVLVHACNPSYSGGRSRRIMSLRPNWAKLVRSYLKNKNISKRAGGMAQVVECLPSIHKALGSIHSNVKQMDK
jgi:hypothetical protein